MQIDLDVDANIRCRSLADYNELLSRIEGGNIENATLVASDEGLLQITLRVELVAEV